VKELNKTFKSLKIDIESLKKTQSKAALAIENIGKRTGVTMQASPTEYKVVMIISAVEDNIQDIKTKVKKNTKKQEAPISKHSRNPGHIKTTEPENNRYRRE
jgi:iron only hydrogenase large subunit-like protein